MDRRLFIQAISKVLGGVVLLGLLLFGSAGTLEYWNGWLLMGLLFIPMFIAGIVLMIKNPELLRKRLDMKENEPEQKTVILVSTFMFVGGFVVAGLDYRFGWSTLPKAVVIVASVLFVLAYLIYAEVLRENAYLARTVKVQENQKVIDTGLYGIVRHPMYAATILLFMSMPLVLGSLYAFIIFLLYPVVIAKRMKNEEKVLAQGLQGYAEYMKKVRYRVIPFVW